MMCAGFIGQNDLFGLRLPLNGCPVDSNRRYGTSCEFFNLYLDEAALMHAGYQYLAIMCIHPAPVVVLGSCRGYAGRILDA